MDLYASCSETGDDTVEEALRFQKDTDEQRMIRSQLAGIDRTIQQLQLQRDKEYFEMREADQQKGATSP